MKINELVRSLPTWTSAEERTVLERINGIEPLSVFNEREQHVIESLVRKSLVIRITERETTYIYPNV
jgi:hypothetical protein